MIKNKKTTEQTLIDELIETIIGLDEDYFRKVIIEKYQDMTY